MKINIDKLNDKELWRGYADIQQELKKRGLVRTNNIVGERGEFIAIETYNSIKGTPNLQAAPEGTQNVDALSRKGEGTQGLALVTFFVYVKVLFL